MPDEVDQVMEEVNQRTLPPSIADNFGDGEAEEDAAESADPELQEQLAANQVAQAKIAGWLTTFHGPTPRNLDGLRAQVAGGRLSGADYLAQTGRVYSADPMAGALETDPHAVRADTSGLDAIDRFQHGISTGRDEFAGALSFSDDPKGPPIPGSIDSALSPGVDALGQTDGHAMAVDTLRLDTRLQPPTALSVAGPAADGTRRSVSNNNLRGAAAWQGEQRTANASIKANFRATGLPDPTIGASVLNIPGGGTVVNPGNLGVTQAAPNGPPGVPPGILRNWRPR